MEWVWNVYKSRFTTYTRCKRFQKNKNLKVMECFQMFKESFIADLKEMFLHILIVSSIRIVIC